MSRGSFLNRLFHSQVFCIAIVSLITLFWSIPAFCGEIRKASKENHKEAVALPPAAIAVGAAKVDCRDMPLMMLLEEPCGYSEKEIMFPDGPFRTKLNGQKLKLDPYSPDEDSDDFTEAKITLLSTGRVLLSAGNKIYLLDDKMRVVWNLDVGSNDYAVVESTGLVYITAVDNTLLIVELASGKELYRNSRNGSAAYGQVVPFGNDQCLILDDNSGYRMKNSLNDMKDLDLWEPDGITAWRGTNQLWHKDFPPDARLMVKGNRIYAVTKTISNIYFRELSVPKL